MVRSACQTEIEQSENGFCKLAFQMRNLLAPMSLGLSARLLRATKFLIRAVL